MKKGACWLDNTPPGCLQPYFMRHVGCYCDSCWTITYLLICPLQDK